MTRRPQATVTVMKLPHLAEGCVRIEVDCRYSTTGLTSFPGDRLDMPLRQLITAAVMEHEARCDGECDTTAAHERGDPHIRAHVEQLGGALQAAMARQYAHGRRN